MTTAAAHLEDAKEHAEEAMRTARPWVAKLARLGFAVKGLVYIIIGVLATKAAFRAGGATTDQRGALATIAHQPFGRVMLIVAGAGLAGYALWRLSEALLNLGRADRNAKGVMKRLAQLVSGVVYASLSFAAFQMASGSGSSGGGGNRTRDWTASLMRQPMGTWLVGIVGAGVIAAGLWQLWRAWKTNFGNKLSLHELGSAAGRSVIVLGRIGTAARGVVFGLIGTFLIIAAQRHNPHEAAGIGEALQSLETVDYGPWLLAVVAIGLIAYGVYELFEARYRRINVG